MSLTQKDAGDVKLMAEYVVDKMLMEIVMDWLEPAIQTEAAIMFSALDPAIVAQMPDDMVENIVQYIVKGRRV